MARWARTQAQSGIRYTTADELWRAADEQFPQVLPANPQRLARDWPLTRDLLHAYVSGLEPIEVGDLVRLTRSHRQGTGTVTAIHSPAGLRVRLDDIGAGSIDRQVDMSRLHVDPIPCIYYTASIVTFDGSDTNAYGEACQPGEGYIEQSGWWDPDWAYWRVVDSRIEVTPDTYDDTDDAARWLARQLTARLGPISSHDGVRTFYSAGESVQGNPATDPPEPAAADLSASRPVVNERHRILTAAGHCYGFSSRQLTEAAGLLNLV